MRYRSTHFIATEFIDGETLRSSLARRTQMEMGGVLDVAIQVTSALAAAHAAGIVHRDVKPENIMLRRDSYAPHQSRSRVFHRSIQGSQLCVIAHVHMGRTSCSDDARLGLSSICALKVISQRLTFLARFF